jgi:uncharacterized SAM-binding protein YcdF (DUF218 family)
MVIGVTFLLYFAVIVIYTKTSTAFGGFFIASGLGLILLSNIYKYLGKRESTIYPFIEKMTWILLILGILVFFIILRVILINGKKSKLKEVDYLIILGARINGNRITKSLKYRLDTALEFLENNKQTKVIVSGGRGEGENITEAQAMKEYLVSKGFDNNRVIKEDRSRDTNQNIKYSKDIIKDTSKTILIVTNTFHLYRSLQIARKQGFTSVEGLGAPSDKVLVFSYYIREVFAVLKDKLFRNMR